MKDKKYIVYTQANKLGLTTHFDIGIAEGVVDDMWNDFWGYY